jgi:hypothetical protein
MDRNLTLDDATPSAASHAPRSKAAPKFSGRASFVMWLRKAHGWIGLWGATLGLLFGTSGIWLNHRNVLQLPPVAQQRTNTQLALPDPAPADAQALAVWLQGALQLDAPANNIKVEPSKPVAWAERGARGDRAEHGDKKADGAEASEKPAGPPKLMQPEHWTIMFGGPHTQIMAETWAGNRSVSIRHVDTGFIGTLMNLHKGVGMSVPWILLVDTLAGSLILLSLSGLVLWVMTHRRRTLGFVIFGSALAVTLGLAVSRM